MSKIILYGVAFVLVTASVVMGMDAYSTYQILQVPVESPQIKPEPVEISARKRKKEDYSVIVSRNLFGEASLKVPLPKGRPRPKIKTPVAVTPSKENLPPLTFILVGTTVGPKGVRYAILEDKSSRTHTIHGVGDSIQGAVIQAVERGEVTLLHNGKIVTLHAFDNPLDVSPGSSGRVRQPKIPGFRGRSDFPNRRNPPRTQSARSFQPRKLNRRLNRSRLENLAASSDGFENQVRVVDYQGNDGKTGIRVFPSRRGGLIRLLGLRGGDVVHEIDGVAVSSRYEFQSAIMNFLGRSEATMKISRRGQRYDFIFRIQ